MDKPKKDSWIALDSHDINRIKRAKNSTRVAKNKGTDLSHIDFEMGEKIELTGSDASSRLQYFCTRAEFRSRLEALLRWASNNKPSIVYGTVTINEDFLDVGDPSIDSAEGAIAKFEDFFVRNIRVPRKYMPPGETSSKKRKTDNPSYKDIKGNFDLVRRVPSTINKPHMLEFILYECGLHSALKKTKKFEDFARDVGLNVKVQVSLYSGKMLNR